MQAWGRKHNCICAAPGRDRGDNETHLLDSRIEGDAERLAVEAIAGQRSCGSRRRHLGLSMVTKPDVANAYGGNRISGDAGARCCGFVVAAGNAA